MKTEWTNECLIKDIREEMNPAPTPVQKQHELVVLKNKKKLRGTWVDTKTSTELHIEKYIIYLIIANCITSKISHT